MPSVEEEGEEGEDELGMEEEEGSDCITLADS